MLIFLIGAFIGLCIAMPVGPIGVLCIRYSLSRGMAYGLAAGLGAALADAFFGMVAAFGISLVTTLLVNYKTWFHVIGAAFLCYLGVRTFLAKPLAEERSLAATSSGTLMRTFFTTFLLTLANPLTILSFGGVYAGVDLDRFANGDWSPWVLVSGVFIGSAVWWLLLSWGVAFLGKMLNFKPNAWLNRLSGSVILLFGIMTLIPLFFL